MVKRKTMVLKPKSKNRKGMRLTPLEPAKINKMRNPNKKSTKTIAKRKAKKKVA